MPKLIAKRRAALLLAMVAVGAGTALGWTTVVRSANAPTPVAFGDVSSTVLAARGIDLTVPTTSSASAAADTTAVGATAASAASDAFGGATVLESHFANCVALGGVDQDCWAISLDPSGFHSHPMDGSTPTTATYMVVLVDPATDQILHAQAGTGS